MSKELIKQYENEVTTTLKLSTPVSDEELKNLKYTMLVQKLINDQELIEREKEKLRIERKKLEFEQEKFEKTNALEDKKVEYNHELAKAKQDMDYLIAEKEIAVKELLAKIEDKKIDTNLQIAQINAENDKKNRRTNMALGVLKLGSLLTLGAADMTMTYIDDCRVPKLFQKAEDNLIK